MDDDPQKYIRTFSGDIQTFKSGGTPDLAPLVKAPHTAAAPETTQGTAQERLVAPSPVLPPAPTAPVVAAPAPVKEPAYVPPSPAAAPIQTYAGDFSQQMKATNASATTVLAAEQDAAPVFIQSSTPESVASNRRYLIAGILLLIVGIVGATLAYLRYQTMTAPVVLSTPVVTAPIFVDEREQISGSGLALLKAIEQSVALPIASGSVRLLYTDGSATTTVLSALPVSAPQALMRNVKARGSMAGVVFVDGKQSPFFILSVFSFGNTFSSMLSWERTMPKNLAELFPAYPAVASSTATSTESVNKTSTPVAGFSDATVANHDVRVYRDSVGRTILLYGYWDQTTLVIARDEAAFAEILGRLATSRAQN